MAENINNNENFNNAVSGVERISKKKGKKIALISGITAVALVGGGTAVYNLSDFVKNQVNLRVMKPANYYAWVTEENAKNFASSAKESYQKTIDRTANGQTGNVSLKYTATDDFKDYVLNEILGAQYNGYTDEESQMIVGIINNINEVAIGGNVSVKDNLLSGDIFASLNGENLISSDIALDYDNFEYFMRVPALTEQWLCVLMEENMPNYLMGTASENLMKNPAEYLSAEELEDIIIRYTNVWNETVSDIELEKKEAVDICDITMDYTVVSVEFTEADVIELSTNYVNELKNDEIIKNMVVNKMEICTEDEYIEELDDILEELSEKEVSDSDISATFNTYIDPKGDIRGIKLIADSEEFFMGFGKDGDNVRGEVYFSEDNEKDFSVEIYADETDGKYNGNIDFTVYDSEDTTQVSVEFVDYEVVNEDNGYFNAGVTLIIPNVDPIAVDFTSDGNSQDISYNINFDGTDYGTVTLSMSANDGAEVSMPAKDGAFIISPYTDSEPDLEDYIPEENMKTFIHDVLVKIGFSEEVATDGADDITEEIYSDNSATIPTTYETYDSEIDWDDIDDTFGGFDTDEGFTYDDTKIEEETETSTLPYDSTINYSQGNADTNSYVPDFDNDEDFMYFGF
ncbi:MAG: hypothetical protein K2L10_11600 [Ruminococcus sp.]|nr:hypothetical protein [Ruminococcus sp.]